MGFYVYMQPDDKALFGRLSENPAALFGRPYAAYLAFLITAADSKQVAWLRTNIKALDSLTGDLAAFAVFAECVPFSMRVADHALGDTPRRHLSDVNTIDVERIERWANEGVARSLPTLEGRQAHARTVGADRAARFFGLTNRMPCIAVFSAMGDGQVDVIPFDDAALEGFLPMLRRVLGEVAGHGGYAVFTGALASLGECHRRLEEVDRRLFKLEERKRRSLITDALTRLDAAYSSMRVALYDGSHGEFRKHARRVREMTGMAKVNLSEEHVIRFVRHGRTIGHLQGALRGSEDSRTTALQRVFSPYVQRLLPDAVWSDGDGEAQAQQWLADLQHGQREVVKEVLGMFPSLGDMEEMVRNRHARSVDCLNHHHAELSADRGKIVIERGELVKLCLSEAVPCFQEKLRADITQTRMNHTAHTLAHTLEATATQLATRATRTCLDLLTRYFLQ